MMNIMSDITPPSTQYRQQINWAKWGLIITGMLLLIVFLVAPMAWIFMTEFSKDVEISAKN